MNRVDDIDRALAQVREASALLAEVRARAPALIDEVPGGSSAVAPLRDELVAWTRLLAAAAAETDEWERSLRRERCRALAEAAG